MGTPASKPGKPHWLTWVALAGCAVAVWLVFGGARDFHFVVWDDDHNIQQNTHLSGLTWENLRWMFTDSSYVRRYIPVAWLGWNLDRELFGLTPYSAHMGNVLFHVLNTVLVFFVITAWLRRWLPRENEPGRGAAIVAATLGALVWALHPLRVEVVAWASARIYAQAASFLLLSAWCYLKSQESAPGTPSARSYRWGSAVGLALSLLTYPLALSYVAILLALEWHRSSRTQPAASLPWPSRVRGVLQDNIPFLVITAGALLLTLWARTNVQAVGWRPPVTLDEFGVVPRIMQACYIWAYYLWKPLLPVHLSPYYTRLISFSPGDWEFLTSLAAIGVITAGLFKLRQRWPGAWLLWLCHLLVLAPVLGLFEHPHFANDRYSYVAAVPWSVALAVIIVRLWNRVALRWAAIVSTGVVVAAAGALSLTQLAVWRDTETLGKHMLTLLADHPRRFDIYGRMAAALREEGKPAESNAYYVKSLGGDPAAADKALDQGKRLEAQGQPAQAFVQYLLAAQLKPDLAEPRYRLAVILLADRHPAEAVPFLQDVVRLQPDLADAQLKLGLALFRTNRAAEAIAHYEQALRVSPDDPAAHNGLGAALATCGRPQEAIAHFEQVIRLHPDSASAHFNRGLALLDGLGRAEEAGAEFETVLQLRPDYPGVREALARSRR